MNCTEINFAFCFDEKYAQYASVCIRSIAMHHPEKTFAIHILHDYLSEFSIKRLRQAACNNNCNLQFYSINNEDLSNLPLKKWPVQAWYRILLPEILPNNISKVLYLDCDTLVLSDLSELFQLDLSGKAFAAVEDPQSFYDDAFERCKYDKGEKYICSGIMLLNLDYWRKNNIKTKLLSTAERYKETVRFPDQDCLNILCRETKLLLPYKYGITDWFFKNETIMRQIRERDLLECLVSPCIVHFAGCAPWLKELRPSLFSEEWDKVNKTLRYRARKIYICKGMRFIRMILYKMRHPIVTIKKHRSQLTIQKLLKELQKDE